MQPKIANGAVLDRDMKDMLVLILCFVNVEYAILKKNDQK
ncbi:MAG: hypothetical protein ACI8RD_003191 [Bacillariaceae sp.]|jgi:hypothetical protein